MGTMSDAEQVSNDRRSSALNTYLVTIAIVTWAFAQPMLPFANLTALLFSGLLLGAGVAIMMLAFYKAPMDRTVLKIGAVVTGLGVFVLIGTAVGAINRADQNDARCLAIRNDMLSVKPVRADDAAVYQALGCRQQ
jgi:hypothetical protein